MNLNHEKYFWYYISRSRISAAAALDHKWLKNAGVLRLNKAKLKKYVIKKRWIKISNTIIALQRMGAKLEEDIPSTH